MVKVAINGFGRIGRGVFKAILEKHPGLKVAVINDLTDVATLAHLLKYDSVYGKYGKPVKVSKNDLIIDSRKVSVLSEKDPANLPWKDLGIDIVLECTGIFRKYGDAARHIEAGAKKVIISAPAKSDDVPAFVLGVNANDFNVRKHDVVDMASCTTNCLAPVAKVLNDNFKIKKGFMATIHAYTSDQRLVDLSHRDLRRARAAAINIIPTTTGAAKAIGKVIPELSGKLDGVALRVPVITGSLLDLVCEIEKKANAQEINGAFKKAAQTKQMKGILKVEDEPLVSSDYIGNPYSAIVDSLSTKVMGNLVKVTAWYDNEYGYNCRLAEFAEFVGKKL